MLSSLYVSDIWYKNEANWPFSWEVLAMFPLDLLMKISRLPIRPDREIKFVDFDDTLWDSNRRFQIDQWLEENRWDLAIAYIRRAYGNRWDPTWLYEFVSLLQVHNHLFETDEFYQPENPQHVILTAGHLDLQRLKVESAGYRHAKRILVRNAENKPLAILRYILKLGYIPGKIEFIDDRMDKFRGIDNLLAEILKVSVVFQKAIPNTKNASVELVRIIERRVQNTIAANDSHMYIPRRSWDIAHADHS